MAIVIFYFTHIDRQLQPFIVKDFDAPVTVLRHLAFAVPEAGVTSVLLGALGGHSLILFLARHIMTNIKENRSGETL